MSEYQKEIRRELAAKGKQVLRHVIRLVLYPDSQENYNHWKQEIVAFISDVDKVKGKNKWPNKEFIKEAISTQNDMIDAVIRQVKLQENELRPRNVDSSVVLNAVEEYQDWLAGTLSRDGIIDPYEAFDVLDEIVDRTRD